MSLMASIYKLRTHFWTQKKIIIESKIQKLEPNVEIKRQKAHKRQEKGWVRSAWRCREKGSAALVWKEFWVMVGYVNIRCGERRVSTERKTEPPFGLSLELNYYRQEKYLDFFSFLVGWIQLSKFHENFVYSLTKIFMWNLFQLNFTVLIWVAQEKLPSVIKIRWAMRPIKGSLEWFRFRHSLFFH